MGIDERLDGASRARELCAGLIFDEERRLLLVHNIKHGLRIEPPGGKRKTGAQYVFGKEPYSTAVKRECLEELGITVEVGEKLGAYRTASPEGTFLCHMYQARIIGGEITLCEPHIINNYAFYTHGQLEALASSSVLVPNLVAALDDLRPLMRK